jgi:GNAT superfamily N-acetyltransferase
MVRVRPGIFSDIDPLSKSYAEAWRSTYEGLAPDVFARGMTPEAAKQIFQESLESKDWAYYLHVAEAEDGRIVGFVDGGKERSHPEQGIGELYAIYLLKEFQRQGIGRKLFAEAIKSLAGAGMNSMVLWVLEKSPNHDFYRSMGGKLQPGLKTLDVAQHKIQLVSYFWEKLR